MPAESTTADTRHHDFLAADPAQVVSGLTVEQKADLVTGATFWTTAEISGSGSAPDVPAIMLTDGPHGLRKQAGAADHLGLEQSVPATCFPPAVALGSSFDRELARRVGEAIGAEAQAEGVGVVLGPGLNIKRSPLCGRNFEYLSEDPLVSGEMAAALTEGIQSRGVGASLKHFAANNQEHDRMRSSSDVDPRPLREIYLRGFERAVKQAQPWTVMSSYNRINGTSASENHWLLTGVLREDWGFEGLVVSDWFAVADRAKALQAGLDLEMPTTGGLSRQRVLEALGSGELEESVLDDCAVRVIRLIQQVLRGAPEGSVPEGSPAEDSTVVGSAAEASATGASSTEAAAQTGAHHELAREAAARSAVLLKNEQLLPLAPQSSVAVIGEFARQPRFQGAGSSQINPIRVDDAYSAIVDAAQGPVSFAPGFRLPGEEPAGSGADQDWTAQDSPAQDPTAHPQTRAEQLRSDAAETAAGADVAVIFLGLPAETESEGFDREHIDLPAEQLDVLDAVLAANPNTVVVLSHGGVVTLPFAPRVPAVLDAWLLGQAGGSATADLLYGEANPSGKLAETIPLRLTDSPAYLNFPGEHGHVRYGEGIFVGYRWYDARQMEVAFPFGHGLSYTRFDYADLEVEADDAGLHLRAEITNSGQRSGREVVQVYVGRPESSVARPPRELKAFASVELAAGQSRTVELTVPREDLAHWDIRLEDWVVEGGRHAVAVGASSRDLRLETTVELPGDEVALPLSEESTLGDALAHPVTGPMIRSQLEQAPGADDSVFSAEGMLRMMESFPLGRISSFAGSGLDSQKVQELIALTRRD